MKNFYRLILLLAMSAVAVPAASLHAVTAPDLGDVITYPSPFNAARGHTTMKFDHLTGDIRLRVYKITGESVFDQRLTAVSGAAAWDVTNNDGYPLAPGIYVYLITNDAAQKASGKVVIIR